MLDSRQAEEIFAKLYLDDILDPAHLETRISQTLESLKHTFFQIKNGNSIFDDKETPDLELVQTLLAHPLPLKLLLLVGFGPFGKSGSRMESIMIDWDLLVVSDLKVIGCLDIGSSINAFERSSKIAEKQSVVIYDELLDGHKAYINCEVEKKEHYF